MASNVEKFGVEATFETAKFEQGVRRYDQALGRAEKSTRDFQRGATQASEGADRATAISTKNMAIALSVVVAAIHAAIQTLRMFARVAKAAFVAAREGADKLRARRVFAQLTDDIGGAAKTLEVMRTATRSAATDQALMEQATGLLTLKIVKSSEELGKAARSITTVANLVKGFSAERAIQSFTLLASNFESSKLRLDDFGLTLDDVQPKIDAYAASGASASEAIRLALLESIDQKFIELGGSVEDAALAFDQLEASAANVSDRLKQSLAPAMTIVVEEMLTVTTGVEEQEDSFYALSESLIKVTAVATAFGVVYAEVAASMTRGTTITDFLAGNLDTIAIFQETYNRAMETGGGILKQATRGQKELAKATEEAGMAAALAGEDWEKYQDKLEQLRLRGLEQLIQQAISAERQIVDAAIARARRIEDLERQTAQRREQIAQQAARRRAQIEQQYTQAIVQAEAQARQAREAAARAHSERLEQIERQYQERKRQIEEQFAQSFGRAIRSRDALALIEAIRTRKKDLDEAKRQRDEQKADAGADYNRQLDDQRRALEEQRRQAQEARRQQLADLQENIREQEQDLEDNYQKQIDDLDRNLEQQRQDRERAAQRQLQDMLSQFRTARAQALGEYRQDETAYRNHLERMLALTNAYIPSIFGTLPGAGGYRPQTGGGPGGPQSFAEGGAFVTQGTQQITVGEVPEMVIVQPLRQMTAATPTGASVGGQMRHQVSGAIEAQMEGFQGRLSVAISQAVNEAMMRVLQ